MSSRESIAGDRQRAVEAAYRDYYDCLTEDGEAEQNAWGEFAESQVAEEVC